MFKKYIFVYILFGVAFFAFSSWQIYIRVKIYQQYSIQSQELEKLSLLKTKHLQDIKCQNGKLINYDAQYFNFKSSFSFVGNKIVNGLIVSNDSSSNSLFFKNKSPTENSREMRKLLGKDLFQFEKEAVLLSMIDKNRFSIDLAYRNQIQELVLFKGLNSNVENIILFEDNSKKGFIYYLHNFDEFYIKIWSNDGNQFVQINFKLNESPNYNLCTAKEIVDSFNFKNE